MKKLIEKADRALLKMQCAGKEFFRSLKEDERGVSPIVATVLTILITVLLAVIFWDFIKGWIETIWTQITGEASKIK